ncbi:MAG: glycoside hydrolase family 3 N-terminal domain-containing protein [Bacilli bacterium]|nr:glycoside hydrolase family 3 N-terminal domain-containing protein [Bacilli bacterium]
MNNKLSLKEKLGQMILLGLNTKIINDEIKSLIKDYHIGGVVLYRQNYSTLEEMVSFINELKEINKDNKLPLFISIDQENGRVNRLPNDINRLYNVKRLADTKDMSLVNEWNKITAEILSSVGVNMNFAPVLDIYRNTKNQAIGNRSYGNTKEAVMKYAFPLMKELQKNNVIPVIKHFPGQGLAKIDSHTLIPYIQNTKELFNEDMVVFKEAFNEGADVVLVGHVRVKSFGFRPASLNIKFINKFFIDEIKYKGLIVTDDLKMNYLKFNVLNNIRTGIDAGNHLIMIKYKKGDLNNVYKKLYADVASGKVRHENIENSAYKIIKIKEKYLLTNQPIKYNFNKEEVNNRINKLNNDIDAYFRN